MIFLVLLAYWLWGYGFLKIIFRKALSQVEYVLAYPVGLAVSGLFLFSGWLSQIPFHIMVMSWWFGAVVCMLWFAHSEKGFSQKLIDVWKKMTWKSIFEKQLTFRQWPWLYMGAVLAISLFVAGLWQIFFSPISWDTVALYDFRAWRVVDGWMPNDFMTQFLRLPDYRAYDFLHPITSSLWWAVAYQSGAEHVLVLYTALLVHLIALGWFAWKSWSARIVWPFLWVSMPMLFVSLTEGYGAYPAVLFLSLALVWWYIRQKKDGLLSLNDWSVFGALMLGSVSGRITEYYWLVFLLVTIGFIVIRYKFQIVKIVKTVSAIWLLPGMSLVLWFWIRSQAVLVSGSTDADRSVRALLSDMSGTSFLHIWTVFVQELSPWITSPAVPWIVLLFIGVFFVWKKNRKFPVSWKIWGALLVGCLGVLLMGMMALHIVFAERWIEARQALDRAIMPLLAICFIWLTDLTERFSSQE